MRMAHRNGFYHEVNRSAENKSGTDYTDAATLSTANCKVNKFKKDKKIRWIEISLNFSQQ